MKAKKQTSESTAPSPSLALLTLLGSFFTEHGLEGTRKAFTREVKKLYPPAGWSAVPEVAEGITLQALLDNWENGGGKTISKDTSSGSEATMSDSDDSSTSSGASSEHDSASSDSSSDSSSESEDEAKQRQTQTPRKSKGQKRAVSPSSSSASSSSSSSDSDADDEDEVAGLPPSRPATSAKKTQPTQKAAISAVKKNLKRKAASTSSESSSESDSSNDDRPAKRTKGNPNDTADNSTSSDETSSSDSENDESENEEGEQEQVLAKASTLASTIVAVTETHSDSSATVTGDSLDMEPDVPTLVGTATRLTKGEQRPTPKRKHVGAMPTPLAQLSALATPDSHISNQYRSYDYADRAYNDLSVTRGKGFTKEKNKKKRGSYRGGPIDISGGKSFKFDD